MAPITGAKGVVDFQSGTNNLVVNVTAWALSEEAKVYDATVYGTAADVEDTWEDYIVGTRTWSGTLSFIQDGSTAIDWSGQQGTLTLYVDNTAGPYYSGTAIITVQRLDHAIPLAANILSISTFASRIATPVGCSGRICEA